MPEEHEQMEEKLQRKFFTTVVMLLTFYFVILTPYRTMLAESQLAGSKFFGEDG